MDEKNVIRVDNSVSKNPNGNDPSRLMRKEQPPTLRMIHPFTRSMSEGFVHVEKKS